VQRLEIVFVGFSGAEPAVKWKPLGVSRSANAASTSIRGRVASPFGRQNSFDPGDLAPGDLAEYRQLLIRELRVRAEPAEPDELLTLVPGHPPP
jgi:hypothetical protein